jgi:hypothetical protein
MSTLLAALAWLLAHHVDLLKIASAIVGTASLVVALLPESAAKVRAVAILGRLSVLTHYDSPGTLKLLFAAAVKAVGDGGAAKPAPRVPPMMLLVLVALALGGCVRDAQGQLHTAPAVHETICGVAQLAAAACGIVDPSAVVHILVDGRTQIGDDRAEVIGNVIAKVTCGVARAQAARCAQ